MVKTPSPEGLANLSILPILPGVEGSSARAGKIERSKGPRWTPRLVAAHLADAALTLQQQVKQEPDGSKPTSHEQLTLSAMPNMLGCLQWLGAEEQKIAWDRANGLPWKTIAHSCGVDCTTAWRRWTCAMTTVAARLNALSDATVLQHVATSKRATNQRGCV